MIFCKYEFTPEQWEVSKKEIQAIANGIDGQSSAHFTEHVVELGHLVITPAVIENMEVIEEAILSDMFSVDILWSKEPLASFDAYEVFPEPCGVHTFAGLENVYAERYYSKYPEKRPVNELGEPSSK